MTLIRPAELDDVARLREVERAAGRPFAALGMQAVADDEPPAPEVLAAHVRNGTAWVHTVDGVAAAYALAALVDGDAHLDQVSVDPAFAHRRLGRGLIEQVAAWGRAHGLPALTLTTFREVPWNGPYYERCGFRWLADDEITPGLRARRAAEAASGLDAWPRGCMRREIPRNSSGGGVEKTAGSPTTR